MKTLILSCLMIFGLTAQNYGKPINDIFSIKNQVYFVQVSNNDLPSSMNEVAVASAPDSNAVQLGSDADLVAKSNNTGVNRDKKLSHLKIKNEAEVILNNKPSDPEKVFYEKLSEHLTQQSIYETGTDDIPSAIDNNFCCYEFNVPRSVSDLLKATAKE